jgi:DNA-binding MarR family transcriptional regulator
MGSGPGKFERAILLALYSYEQDYSDVEWDFGGSDVAKRNLVLYDAEIRAYQAGRRIEMSELIRATEIKRAALSRSLHQLYRKGLVLLRSTDLEEISSYTQSGRYAKFAGLTTKGREVAKQLKARTDKRPKSTPAVPDG